LANVLGFEKNRVMRVEEGGVAILSPAAKASSHGKGLVLFELSHFASLLAAGNHRWLEQLYLRHGRRYECQWFAEIVKQLDSFRGKQAIEHLCGVMRGCVAAGRPQLAWRFALSCEELAMHDRWPRPLSEEDKNLCLSGGAEALAERAARVEAAKKSAPLRNTTPGRDWLAAHVLRLRKAR
jgi:hypothetical protein